MGSVTRRIRRDMGHRTRARGRRAMALLQAQIKAKAPAPQPKPRTLLGRLLQTLGMGGA